MALVRIVTPTFNRASLVLEAIDSARRQTFTDFEMVVVDDGSSDDTVERLRPVARDDRRIRVIAAAHGGVAAARNVAIGAPGDFTYAAFLDADDRWEPRHLEMSLRVLEAEPEVTLVSGVFVTEDLTGTWSPREFQQRTDKIGRMTRLVERMTGPGEYILDPRRTLSAFVRGEIYPYTSTVVVRRDSAGAQPWYDPSLTVSEDSDFYLRLATAGRPWAFLDVLQCVVRFHGDNLTRSTDLSAPATLIKQRASLECHRRRLAVCQDLDDRAHVRRGIAERAYLVGQCCDAQGDFRGARDAYLESLSASAGLAAAKGLVATLLPDVLLRSLR